MFQVELLFNHVEARFENAFDLPGVTDLYFFGLDFVVSIRRHDIYVEVCSWFELVFTDSGFLLPRHWNRHFLSEGFGRSLWLRAQVFTFLLIFDHVFRHHLLLFLLDLSPLYRSAHDLLHLGRK